MSVISSSTHQRSSLTESTPTDAPSFIKAGQENSTSMALHYEDLGSGPPASYRSSVTGSAKATRMRFLFSAGTTIAAMFLLLSHSAEAQVAESGYSLPSRPPRRRSVRARRTDTRCRPPWSTHREWSRSSSKATIARSTRRILAFAKPIRSSHLDRSSTWTRAPRWRILPRTQPDLGRH
jgi:hypothetical protein